jgi:hypothetical protein
MKEIEKANAGLPDEEQDCLSKGMEEFLSG